MNLFQKALGYIARSIGLTDPRLAQAVGGRTTTTGEVPTGGGPGSTGSESGSSSGETDTSDTGAAPETA